MYSGVVPGVRNPWLFTAAHFGAEVWEKGNWCIRALYQG